MPANAKVLRRAAMVTRRVAIMGTRRVLAAIGRLPIVRSASTGMIVLAATTAAAKSAPTRRAAKVFARPPRDGARNFDKPRFDKPRFDKPREDRGGDGRPRFSRPREDRPQGDRPFRERPKFDRPREGGSSWQEHPRSDAQSSDRSADRPRRDNEDDSKVFVKRPAFGGRGEYRERKPDERRPPRPPRAKKSGERIAKVVSRAGLASRRDAEEWIVQGRVTVNGRVINSPALDVTANDVITVDGKPLPPRERTRLFMFHAGSISTPKACCC